jgi:MoxR-vWA-beta-propeller ternary system domain bpX4
MNDFLTALFSTGVLSVSRDESLSLDSAAGDQLAAFEQTHRSGLPCAAPPFDAEAGARAAACLCLICQSIVHREIDERTVASRLAACGLLDAGGHKDSAAVHYSVDLTLRFLPQLLERAARMTASDPLIPVLLQLARTWPLSSVGMAGTEPVELPPALNHSALWRMYIDRIMERKDTGRLNLPAVRAAVHSAIGPFPALAPELHAELQRLAVNNSQNPVPDAAGLSTGKLPS